MTNLGRKRSEQKCQDWMSGTTKTWTRHGLGAETGRLKDKRGRFGD